MNTLIKLFTMLSVLILSTVGCGSPPEQFDTTESVDDVEVRAELIKKLDAEKINYSMDGAKLSYFSQDERKITKLTLDVYDVLFPIYNSLAVDGEDLIDEISSLLTTNNINHNKRVKISDFSHDKRVKSNNGLVTFYYLVLNDPNDICEANRLIEKNIGLFPFNTKQDCSMTQADSVHQSHE